MSAILLDIEGTTTDKRFVTEVLFPFARKRIAAFIAERAREPEVAAAIAAMRTKLGRADASLDEIGRALESWIDEDRKEEPLKTLQGLLWAEGYGGGTLRAHIYPDVAPALEHWARDGKRIAIFSSGSVAAQKLLFRNTKAGDLTRHLSAYFDLSTGPKTEESSYRKIARALDLPPTEIHFYSDAPKEVEAAAATWMHATLVERDGRIDTPWTGRRISSFAGEP